ncbi:PREDICTED: RNA-binding protein 25-like [Papilio polytes]|uniref:RNA-binding protein 25-like n=1 Tax=Papilio polytes TaxID=76194 RepID=UPI000675EEDE|nr:PREDICTED: RNA-binding protein 25-like [Papilio polytes]
MRRVHAAFARDDDDSPPSYKEKGGRRPSAGKDADKSKKGEGTEEKEKENKCAEEKRKHIKSLIDKIPTQKEQLFQYKLDTAQIDNVLMEKKIRPWINKKIIEYIGEPEPTLVDFICSKVLGGDQAGSLVNLFVKLTSAADVRSLSAAEWALVKPID